jgi:hypothetical protein
VTTVPAPAHPSPAQFPDIAYEEPLHVEQPVKPAAAEPAQSPPHPQPAAQPVVSTNSGSTEAPTTLTIVTAILAIDNERMPTASSVVDALKTFTGFRLPVVLYVQPEIAAMPDVQEALDKLAPWARRIVPRTLDEVRALPWNDNVQAIRGLQSWQSSTPGFATSAGALQPLYNTLGFARLPWLLEAAEANYFSTDAFLWLDGGHPSFVSPFAVSLGKSFCSAHSHECVCACSEFAVCRAVVSAAWKNRRFAGQNGKRQAGASRLRAAAG